MAITVKEAVYSPTYKAVNDATNDNYTPTVIEATYIVSGTDDYSAAASALAAAAPTTRSGLFRRDMTLDQKVQYSAGVGVFIGTVSYTANSYEQNQNENLWEFSTGGATRHITQSDATSAFARPTKTAPDFQGAIGVSPNGVEGCDVVVPSFSWSETLWKPSSVINFSYRSLVSTITGTVNSAEFRGYPIGSVLFNGVNGRKRGNGLYEMTYSFSFSPNLENFTVGDIPVDAKEGWEYMWVSYKDSDDAAAKQVVKVPDAVYIESVYRKADFSQLGI